MYELPDLANKQSPPCITTRKSLRRQPHRDFFADFASKTDVDKALDETCEEKYAYHMPQHMGGTRYSKRQRCIAEIARTVTLGQKLLHNLPSFTLRRVQTTTCTTRVTPPTTPATPNVIAAPPVVVPGPPVMPAAGAPTLRTPPAQQRWSPAKTRRFVQFCYEMLGRPPEFLPGGDPCWDGADGIINKIRDILNLHNSRSRAQIRRVLTLVRDAFEEGNINIDAGVKLNAKNSGRKRKLNEDQDRVVAKALHFGFGIEMATTIVNHKRGVGAEVCPSTVRRSAHKAFGGTCHNRATKKTGSKDEDSPWCQGRFHFGLQLQQQFRVDVAGPSMIGNKVVKLFGGVPYVGTISSFDTESKFYKVGYEDGDGEDLEFHELRVAEWRPLDRRSVMWLDEKHKKVVFGATNRHEWLFFVDPEDSNVFLAEEDGGVLMEEKPNTQAKYMKECRGMFGVLMKQRGDSLVGDRITPFNYTLQKVVGPAKYRKLFWREVERVTSLKTTGTSRSKYWKDLGEGLEGGPYQARFGSNWRQEVENAIGKGPNAVICVTKLMQHAIDEGNRVFADTPYRYTWVIYHDALSSWWSKEAQVYMTVRGFADRQIRGLGHTNVGTRYEGSLPGDTPSYMPLDSNLFADLETATRWNVAATRHLARGHPDRFDLTTPKSAWSAVSRTWEYAPTPQRIVQDIQRVFHAIDMVVDARGKSVDFDKLRHGRRLVEHQRASRVSRRSRKLSSKPKFGDVEGLHPVSKRCIGNFFDLTLD